MQRNLLVYKRGWMVIFSGFFEPLFYLLGIGYGLGTLVGGMHLSDGRTISYAAFVAPALLAQASMNGAIAESIFNVFFKLNFSKTYDAILATPLGIREIAIGEMLWSLFRGTLYVFAFVLVMIGMGLVISPMLFLVIPASILIGAAFSAACLATTAYLRTVQDFDLPMGLVVMPMFLFSATFFPISVYPLPIQIVMEATPLFHAVEPAARPGHRPGRLARAVGPGVPGRLRRDRDVDRPQPPGAAAGQVARYGAAGPAASVHLGGSATVSRWL